MHTTNPAIATGDGVTMDSRRMGNEYEYGIHTVHPTSFDDRGKRIFVTGVSDIRSRKSRSLY